MITPVGVTSADYTQAIRNGNPTHVRIVFPVQNRTFTDQHILSDSGITLTTVMNPDTDLTMGKAIATEIVINFINSADLTGLDWTEEFRFDMGVEISETTYWVTVGYFAGSRPESVIYTDVINFVAYDRMLTFDIVADSFIDSLSFPCSIQSIYEGLCDFVGFYHTTDIEAGDENATTMSSTISANPFDAGCSCRDILAWIAEINCCYAVITHDGKVKLKWFSDNTSYRITQDYQFGVSINEYKMITGIVKWGDLATQKWSSLASKKWGELGSPRPSFSISALRVYFSEDKVYFQFPNNYSKNIGIYSIVDNPFSINGDNTVPPDMKRIFERLTGIGTYTPANVETVGNWLIETGDIVTVVIDDDDTEITLPIFNRYLNWNGSVADTYECTSNIERFAYNDSSMTKIKEGGKAHRFVIGLADKYDIINGIGINDNGIEIVGDKYISMQAGEDSWTFNSEGLKYLDDNSPDIGFQITNIGDREENATGIFTEYEPGTGRVVFIPVCRASVHPQSSYYDGALTLEIEDGQDYTDPVVGTQFSGIHESLYPKENNTGFLGKYDHAWGRVYTRSILGKTWDPPVYAVKGQILLTPSGKEEDADKCIAIQTYLMDVLDPTSYSLRLFPVNSNLLIYGTLSGTWQNRSTTETDMNKIIEKGQYWINFAEMTNKPSTLASGTYCLDVNRNSDSHLIQVIYANYVIYTRMLYAGTWGNWYKFSGTQV